MTLVCSTAHTFHYKWFVQLVNIHSNQRLDLRQDMVSQLTHSTQEQSLPVLKVQSQLLRTPTSTTEELKLQTLCNNKKLNETKEGFHNPSFFYYTERSLVLMLRIHNFCSFLYCRCSLISWKIIVFITHSFRLVTKS